MRSAHPDIHSTAWTVNAKRNFVNMGKENTSKLITALLEKAQSSTNNTDNISQSGFLVPGAEGCSIHAPSGGIPERKSKMRLMCKNQTNLLITDRITNQIITILISARDEPMQHVSEK